MGHQLENGAQRLPRGLPLLAASGGAIVNIGAGAAAKAGAGMAPYAASKAAVARMTRSLAEEWKGKVRINALLPTTIDTPANRRDMPKADFTAWVAPAVVAAAIPSSFSHPQRPGSPAQP